MDEKEKSEDVGESPGETEPTPVGTPYIAEPMADVDVYPLRDPSEDPRWALWVAGVWLVIAIGLFLFFIVLLVLGIWYD